MSITEVAKLVDHEMAVYRGIAGQRHTAGLLDHENELFNEILELTHGDGCFDGTIVGIDLELVGVSLIGHPYRSFSSRATNGETSPSREPPNLATSLTSDDER